MIAVSSEEMVRLLMYFGSAELKAIQSVEHKE